MSGRRDRTRDLAHLELVREDGRRLAPPRLPGVEDAEREVRREERNQSVECEPFVPAASGASGGSAHSATAPATEAIVSVLRCTKRQGTEAEAHALDDELEPVLACVRDRDEHLVGPERRDQASPPRPSCRRRRCPGSGARARPGCRRRTRPPSRRVLAELAREAPARAPRADDHDPAPRPPRPRGRPAGRGEAAARAARPSRARCRRSRRRRRRARGSRRAGASPRSPRRRRSRQRRRRRRSRRRRAPSRSARRGGRSASRRTPTYVIPSTTGSEPRNTDRCCALPSPPTTIR